MNKFILGAILFVALVLVAGCAELTSEVSSALGAAPVQITGPTENLANCMLGCPSGVTGCLSTSCVEACYSKYAARANPGFVQCANDYAASVLCYGQNGVRECKSYYV